MKKTICKREYDTATASLIKKITFGKIGESTGYEESLYQTDGGLYFLYVNGGADSIYKEENIKSLGKAKAAEWMEDQK